jgi:hypothetical protein
MRLLGRFRLQNLVVALLFTAWTIAPTRALGQKIGNKMIAYSSSLFDKANAGDDDSQVALGVAYLQGNGVGRSYEQAGVWFQKAYMLGNGDAAGWLGGMYLSGRGVLLDVAKGTALIEESRADGSGVGLRYTALLEEKGVGRPVNLGLALQLYELAAARLDPVSCDRMGLAYQAGRFRKRNITTAAELFECGARAGYSWAQLHLGELYASTLTFDDLARGVYNHAQPMWSEAYELYAMAADSGNRVAAFRAAQCLRDGSGVTSDLRLAETRLIQANRQLYGPAQEALGDLYQQHPELGRTRVISFVLFKRASAHGQAAASSKADELAEQMSTVELAEAKKRLDALQQTDQRFRERELEPH